MMIFRNQRENLCTLFLLSTKFWSFSLTYHFLREPLICFGLESFKEPENDPFDTNAVVSGEWYSPRTDANLEDGSSEKSHPCQYYKISKRLICRGAINYDYLQQLRNEEIAYFVVENYEAASLFRRKYWSPKSVETGEWYMKVPKLYQKLSGQIHVRDSELKINVNMRLLPSKELNGFRMEGEAYSNKVVKISWRLLGNLSLDFIGNRTVISLEMGAGGDGNWKLGSNFTFWMRNSDIDADGWRLRGCLTSEEASENQFVFYTGVVWTQLAKDECKISGDVQVRNIKLAAELTGKVSSPQQRQITIPKSAFSEMTIKNIVFKDSNFYNDFDRDSFEGIYGVQSITFSDSKLEMLPRLDQLFQSFADLKEIYIEGCTAPQLKFGSMPTLRNVRKLSFEGSGPLNFDDASFSWLRNSNLTFLSLRNSNVKISVKGNSVFWSLSNTLKHLDISYSTINREKDFALVLEDLAIVTLMADGLKLRKVPTIGLFRVRKTLEFLSLRGNDFRKNFEKQMFECVLNFPIMPKLRELNLEECHINYIERGVFDNLENLKILHLSYNSLENIQDGWTHVRPQVSYLSLRHNGRVPQVSSFGLYEQISAANLSKFQHLETLDLSDGIFTNINKLISSLGSSLRNLSLRNTGLEDLPENLFEKLTHLENLDLSYNRNIKTRQSFSFNLFRNLNSLSSLDLKSCRLSGTSIYQGDFSETNQSDFLILANLRSLDLSVNNFKILQSKMLRAFPGLKILNLSGNSITEWSAPVLFSGNLDTVFLDENKIEIITPEMLSNIKKLKQVKLGNNPFVCGPYVYEIMKIINAGQQNQTFHEGSRSADQLKLTNFREVWENNYNALREKLYYTIENNGTEVRILDWSEENYICFSWLQAKFIPFTQVDEDFHELGPKKEASDEPFLLWLIAVVVTGVVIAIAVICWKFLDIHLITRAVRSAVALTFIGRDEKGPMDFKYNVFVSYCDKDRSWVVENLLPRLESRSDVKVCLHERDFQVGLGIIENILNSIESSRNIILVLSQAFLKSQWCQYEMQLAQFRLLEKGRDQLLLVFLENIPAVRRPKALRYLMMTKTYLEWPLNPKSTREVDTFWNRLMNSIVIKDC